MRTIGGFGRVFIAVDRQFESALEITELSLGSVSGPHYWTESLGADSKEVFVERHVNIIFKHARNVAHATKIDYKTINLLSLALQIVIVSTYSV
jgi:hypothetical protein